MEKITHLTDIRQTSQYAHFMEKIGWKAPKMDDSYFYLKNLPLLPFNLVKVLRAKKYIPLAKLKKFHPLLVKQQPFLIGSGKWEVGSGNSDITLGEVRSWKGDKTPLIPTKTIWIDLIKTEKQLLNEMKPKTRYNLRLAQKKGLTTKMISGDKVNLKQMESFYELWSKNKPFNWMFKPSFYELKSLVESFGQKCFFVFCYPSLPITNYSFLAVVLILNSCNMSFYWHNCSSKKGKQLFAPTICVWQAIQESKRRKMKVFDFEGVWDERYPKVNKGWLGFTRFKSGFGGKEIYFSN